MALLNVCLFTNRNVISYREVTVFKTNAMAKRSAAGHGFKKTIWIAIRHVWAKCWIDQTAHTTSLFLCNSWYVILYSQLSWTKEFFKSGTVLTMYPKIAKLRWNKFTYNNYCITDIIYNLVTIQGVTTMVTCYYHGILSCVFFGLI